ncbi:hypothetical protein AVEN_161768-1 [Araneus ventricosus]|uniref:Sushi domain-containing protein n=1 Tax=Araneus ventricosus TaxID=182803 RepID=A0A4Y2RMR0_ARAVE|nr:hypothetical protein AVEN_11142-1 [Araneus ventricosus]GBN76945.1 hypothetical protein AVEN_122217-1 [Araneus ventricosus]GBN76969.1 hypothetical protein AVEN_94080-1 [Araneus ventricosus]GBN76978.1 hypothetical protein AVEN_161768-1 [Araneus ventricosus]
MRCLNPGSISNGRVDVIPPFDASSQPSSEDDFDFPIGTHLKYACDDGFILLGEDSINCESVGDWSGSFPMCVKDSKTAGPKSFSGSIGAQLSKCEKLPMVNFKSNKCEIPEIERKILSKDQQYLLDISYAIKSGISPEDLTVQVHFPIQDG